MKRDMDLYREILLHIEADDKYDGTTEFSFNDPEEIGISGHTTEEVAYHINLLIESAMIVGAIGCGALPAFSRLTSQGHDFVENIRDPSIWDKVKEHIMPLQGPAISVIAGVALAEVKKKFGLP